MFARTLKITFTYFIISFSFINYVISEDLTKHAAARIIKGVVGSPGTTTPSIPSPNINKPIKNNKGFINLD